MTWQEKYLAPNIKRRKFKLFQSVQRYLYLLIHALSPHHIPESPPHRLPKIFQRDSELLNTAKLIYESSLNRIAKIEEKAMKLLVYLSAIIAIISFFQNQILTNVLAKYFISGALIAFIISIIISFRCLNIKYTKHIFLDSIFKFDDIYDREEFNQRELGDSFLECAIFNENVADNTVDMLKAAQFALLIAMILSMIAITIPILNPEDPQELSAQNKPESNYKNHLKLSVDNRDSIMLSHIMQLQEENRRLTVKIDSIKLLFYHEQKSAKSTIENPLNQK